MKTRILAALVLCAVMATGCRSTRNYAGAPAEKGDYVVLLHGMGRTHRSMRKMGKCLGEKGYQVVNVSYPSLKVPVEDLTGRLDEVIQEECTDEAKHVHFVTHSFGGILTRVYLSESPDLNLGRVVMLAPPNSGSEIIDALRVFKVDEKLPVNLENFWQLGTTDDDLPKKLAPVNFELGVIAGSRTSNPIYSSVIKGKDDGKVSVESAKVEGMRDFLVVRHGHTFMARSDDVIEQVVHFLEKGEFLRMTED